MAQRAIREYDAKSLRSAYTGNEYTGVLVDNATTYEQIATILPNNQKWVVKPDQLFGKRGKYGLVGVRLDGTGVKKWLDDNRMQERDIGSAKGLLDTFLVEPFVAHTEEYYLAIKTERDADVIYFSATGGVDIEEEWDGVKEVRVGLLENLDKEVLRSTLAIDDDALIAFINQFFAFFRMYGFAYLEVNPFVVNTQGQVVCLDMVARVDTCEAWKQKGNWKDIIRTKAFGSQTSLFEQEVERMDAETGASLKFVTCNPQGSIGLLLGSGGASIAIMDTLAHRGLLDEVINYGELSGNPNYWHNKAYVQGMFDMLYASPSSRQKYLCYLGPIANFTRIDVMGKAFVDALQDKVAQIKEQDIHIVIRRGGVNDTQGLAMIEKFCHEHTIHCYVADGEVSITEALEKIRT